MACEIMQLQERKKKPDAVDVTPPMLHIYILNNIYYVYSGLYHCITYYISEA